MFQSCSVPKLPMPACVDTALQKLKPKEKPPPPEPYPGLVPVRVYYEQLEYYMQQATSPWLPPPMHASPRPTYMLPPGPPPRGPPAARRARLHQLGNPYKTAPNASALLAALVYRPDDPRQQAVPYLTPDQVQQQVLAGQQAAAARQLQGQAWPRPAASGAAAAAKPGPGPAYSGARPTGNAGQAVAAERQGGPEVSGSAAGSRAMPAGQGRAGQAGAVERVAGLEPSSGVAGRQGADAGQAGASSDRQVGGPAPSSSSVLAPAGGRLGSSEAQSVGGQAGSEVARGGGEAAAQPGVAAAGASVVGGAPAAAGQGRVEAGTGGPAPTGQAAAVDDDSDGEEGHIVSIPERAPKRGPSSDVSVELPSGAGASGELPHQAEA